MALRVTVTCPPSALAYVNLSVLFLIVQTCMVSLKSGCIARGILPSLLWSCFSLLGKAYGFLETSPEVTPVCVIMCPGDVTDDVSLHHLGKVVLDEFFFPHYILSSFSPPSFPYAVPLLCLWLLLFTDISFADFSH